MLSQIWRYPVKSCGGELLPEVEVHERGLVGDRAWALVDSQTGLVASIKRPRLWGALLTMSASLSESGLTVRTSSGLEVSANDPDSLDGLVSSVVDRPVVLRSAESIDDPTLERTDPDTEALLENGGLELGEVNTGALSAAAPAGTVFDFAPIHIISTATLEALEASEATAGDPRRFRPNFVVDIDGPAFQENEWPGRQLQLGPDVVLDLLIQSPRCVVPSLAQPGVPKSASTLRAVAHLNRIEVDGLGLASCAGAYATVSNPGTVTPGATASLSFGPG